MSEASASAGEASAIAAGAAPAHAAASAPIWPAERLDQPVVFLLDAASRLEERLLRAWIDAAHPAGAPQPTILRIPSSRRRRGGIDGQLEPTLASGTDPLLAPLRVAWLPGVHAGERRARLRDFLTLRDPRDPSRLAERWIRWRNPDRCRVVAAEPAPASSLRDRWSRTAGSDATSTLSFPDFVARQAALALERAERRLRGARYKVPRLVHEDILTRPTFRGELARLASRDGLSSDQADKLAAKYLREIAASHSPFVIDLVVQLWRFMTGRGYESGLQYDRSEIERVRALSQQHPVVFLPSHKSNMDHGALQLVLHENGLPPNHTAGGINMNFFPLGPLVRRAGTFFIRRSFKDNEPYKLVLRHYIDYLIEKRFPLEWYIEGGRSRSGKLLPPRFGMLAYVVDAYRRGRCDDVQLIPVSIAYDQISDVGDYAAEQLGGEKESEGFFWFVRMLRRMGRRYGKIGISFGEPLSLAKAIGPPDPKADPDPDERSLTLQKIAFDVCVRINQATPITPISLVCLAMLGRGDRALSLPETVDALTNLLDFVDRKQLPVSEELDLRTPEGVCTALDALVENELLSVYDEGPEPVYAIAEKQHLAAAYYRNSVIHYFVPGAIAELALIRAARPDAAADPVAAFWHEAMELRDLLKFEFFFEEKELFRGELRREMSLHDHGFEAKIEQGAGPIGELLISLRPYHSHRVLRPFLEAYRVVGDSLEALAPEHEIDEAAFLRRCLALGHQHSLQRHIKRQESVSTALFGTAIKLAKNRGLWEPGGAELAAARAAFAAELRDTIQRVDGVEALVRSRRAGLFA